MDVIRAVLDSASVIRRGLSVLADRDPRGRDMSIALARLLRDQFADTLQRDHVDADPVVAYHARMPEVDWANFGPLVPQPPPSVGTLPFSTPLSPMIPTPTGHVSDVERASSEENHPMIPTRPNSPASAAWSPPTSRSPLGMISDPVVAGTRESTLPYGRAAQFTAANGTAFPLPPSRAPLTRVSVHSKS